MMMKYKIKTKFKVGDEVVIPYTDTDINRTTYTLTKVRRITIIFDKLFGNKIEYLFDDFCHKLTEKDTFYSPEEFEKLMQEKYGTFNDYIVQINRPNYFINILKQKEK